MSRHFPDFLSAYHEYALDEYCPADFHFWTGISVVAAALERRVWAQQGKIVHYPNIFTLLTAIPGDGKSTAAERGVEILRNLGGNGGPVTFIPPSISKASFHTAMITGKKFLVGPYEYVQTPVFYYAPEASNGLGAIKGGDEIFPLLTEAYDCGSSIEKQTKSNNKGAPEIIHFPCMNVLAGSTFDNLRGMLTTSGIMGGFASRFIYIVQDEKMIRTPRWEDEDLLREEGDAKRRDPRYARLVSDLQQIYDMAGRFVVSREYREAFEAWFPKNDADRYSRESEREQMFIARKHTNTVKVSMVISAAESSDLILTRAHWDRALALVDKAMSKYHLILNATLDVGTQFGTNQLILSLIRSHKGPVRQGDIRAKLCSQGVLGPAFTATITDLISNNLVRQDGRGDSALLRIPGQGKLHLFSSDSRDSKEETAVSGSLPYGVEEDLSRS